MSASRVKRLVDSAQARLLLAFLILTVSAMILAVVGWSGLSNTERALSGFDREVLPEVAQSLELAERTANLAAFAPYVAEANGAFQLQADSEVLREKTQQVLGLANEIPQLNTAAPRLPPLLKRLDSTLKDLIKLTRKDFFLREDLRQQLFVLDNMRERLRRDPSPGSSARDVEPAIDALIAAMSVGTPKLLDYFQRRFHERLTGVGSAAADGATEHSRTLGRLRRIGAGPGNVFDLRRQQLKLKDRKAFLLASTRAISEQMSKEVNLFASKLQRRVTAQSGSVSGAVRSGKTGIILITVLCLLAVANGIYLVTGLMGNLRAVTRVMTRLAGGDTRQVIPATERSDEIGALARAFHVFRDNAVAVNSLATDLREQTRLLETVFNNMNDGLSVFDRDGNLLAWNPQYLAILGLHEDEIRRGMALDAVQDILARHTHENRTINGRLLVDMAEMNQRRQELPQRFERYYADGTVVEFRSRPMPNGGFVTLYSDLTDRKAIEAQLRQAQKMEVLGRLTGGVAHDFNNLLAAIIGNLQLLEEVPDLSVDGGRFTRRALAAAERGAGLTSRLLAFARKQHLTPEAVDVNDLILGMADLMEYSVGAAVEIRFELDPGERVVYADPAQLENALLNLAINSSAAMPDGGVLTLSTGNAGDSDTGETGERRVAITVTDTGQGIPESQIDHVFEPFFTTKERGEGSGLGLSIVYGYVKQSGGDVEISSQVGEGTTVRLLMPAFTGNVPRLESPPPSSEIPRGDGLRVLLVEDDPQVRDAAHDMISRLGYRVRAVASGAAVLDELAAGETADLVFSDVNLGGALNGIQLGMEVAQRAGGTRVLLTSGLSTEQLEREFGLAPGTAVLRKPYRLDELATALREALGRSRA